MYCCSLLQNIILRQLFATCTNHVFTTYTGIQKSQLMWDKDGFKIENVRPTFFICVVAFKFPFNFLSLSRSWTWRLAFSIESPLFIARIVAWVNKSISIATKLAQSGFESLFARQLPATNHAFVIRSILVDYFYTEWACIVIYIIVRTWIQGTSGQRNQYEVVRFSWI